MKYTILYEYYTYSLGCECCFDSYSEITIFKSDDNPNKFYESCFEAPLIEGEDELREYIHEVDSEYDGFDIHPSTQWF